MVGSKQAEHKSPESIEENDMVIRVGSSLIKERDEPMRREGLQARGIYKEVPRPSQGLALAATKRSLILSYNLRFGRPYKRRAKFLLLKKSLSLTLLRLRTLKETT